LKKLEIFQLFPAPIDMESFEISILYAQARFRQRAVSSAKLDCG